MARILIITHAWDDFPYRRFLVHDLAMRWGSAGHTVTSVAGLAGWPEADIALLHVDLSVIPEAYRKAAGRYAVVLNGAVPDIRKRVISRHLVRPGDGWNGPVIIKTDLNCGGLPELRLQQIEAAQRRGMTGNGPFGAAAYEIDRYPVIDSPVEVPPHVWSDPALVVEKFLPERDARGYWMRAWTFFGDRERCTRYLGAHPVIKSGDFLAREAVPVPDELRAERKRLGFDFGKFDFVMHEGRAVLFDANRTPGLPTIASDELTRSNADLALGIISLLPHQS